MTGFGRLNSSLPCPEVRTMLENTVLNISQPNEELIYRRADVQEELMNMRADVQGELMCGRADVQVELMCRRADVQGS